MPSEIHRAIAQTLAEGVRGPRPPLYKSRDHGGKERDRIPEKEPRLHADAE